MTLPYFRKRVRYQQSGQALILILLALSVVLVVTLSVSSRTVTDISTTNYEESSLRAFSAAEAGVEKMLMETNPGLPITGTPGSGSQASFEVYPRYLTIDSKDFKFPSKLKSGESAVLWFVQHNTNGDLECTGNCYSGSQIKDIAWGAYEPDSYTVNTASIDKQPAIEVAVYYDDSCSSGSCQAISATHNYSLVKVARQTFDYHGNGGPSGSPRGNFMEADFNAAGRTVAGTRFHFFSDQIRFNDLGIGCWNTDGCLLLMTIRVLYNDDTRPEVIAIDNMVGGNPKSFPPQGVIIDSLGKSGDTVRRLNVFRTYPVPPAFAEASVFTNQNIVKNIP